jgi:hypothetical protein
MLMELVAQGRRPGVCIFEFKHHILLHFLPILLIPPPPPDQKQSASLSTSQASLAGKQSHGPRAGKQPMQKAGDKSSGGYRGHAAPDDADVIDAQGEMLEKLEQQFKRLLKMGEKV